MTSVETNFSAAFTTFKFNYLFSYFFDFIGMLNTVVVDVNLSELQKTLDKQGIELVDNQKENVVGRKALAEKTKGRRTIPAFRSLLYIQTLPL